MTCNDRTGNGPLRAGLALLALASAALTPAASAVAAHAGGWYTRDQAQRGHQYFNNYCAECHRPDLTGAVGPALVGDAFLKRWGSRPLRNLFDFEHSKMPATNPGSLPDDKLWSITAYILKKNGFEAGSAALNRQSEDRALVR